MATNDIINYVQNDTKPRFAKDFKKFFTDAADQTAGGIIRDTLMEDGVNGNSRDISGDLCLIDRKTVYGADTFIFPHFFHYPRIVDLINASVECGISGVCERFRSFAR